MQSSCTHAGALSLWDPLFCGCVFAYGLFGGYIGLGMSETAFEP
jgi:hypothetical protein